MKPRCSNQRNHALTLVEVVLVIFVLFVLAAILLPSNGGAKTAKKIACINNLKQIGLAEKIWAGDHGEKFPFEVETTNGGAMELMTTSDAWKVFQVMSNELSTPKVIYCPEDSQHGSAATNWGDDLKNKISYFCGVDATDANPNAILSGDDNFELNGAPIKSGWLELSTNAPISWTMERHKKSGNLLLSDGSVQSTTTSGLRTCWQATGLATNRLAIP